VRAYWKPGGKSSGLDTNGGTSRPSYIGLGHELAHVWDIMIDGKINMNEWFKEGGQSIPFAEQYAMHVENQIRAENGIALRTHYSKRINLDTGEMSGGGRALISGTNVSANYHTTIQAPAPLKPMRGIFIYGVNVGF
jgi:hypothetical protein